jgi:hypothetical protein
MFSIFRFATHCLSIGLSGSLTFGATAMEAAHAQSAMQKIPAKNAPSEALGFQSLTLNEGNTCVAKESSGSRCLLTAEDYNQQVYTLEMVSSGAFLQAAGKKPADSTRYLALKSVLYNLYKEQKLQSAGLDSTLDSVSLEACKQVDNRNDTASAKRLRQYYKAHYSSKFKTRRIPVFEIITGSDSAQIQSVFEFLEMQDSVLAASPLGDTLARRKVVARIDSLPWRRATGGDLGPAVAQAAKDLKHAQWSNPIRTPYGYAIICPVDSTWTQEIYLPAIQDSLLLVLKGQDEAFLNQAKSYYRSHQQDFPMPDTLFFKLAICPDSGCMRNLRLRNVSLDQLSEYLMPASTRAVLKAANNSRVPDSVWFETPLGFARMAVAKKRRGKGSRPFDEVKMEIFKRLEAPSDTLISESVQCKQIRRRVADQLIPYLYKDVATLLRSKNLQPGNKTRDQELQGAMIETRARFRREFESWILDLAIEMPDS